jgi:hypothetical protein
MFLRNKYTGLPLDITRNPFPDLLPYCHAKTISDGDYYTVQIGTRLAELAGISL